MLDILDYGFMRNALVAALLIGAAAPLVGIFLVQRRLSLIGDGLGHVALAGVAIGILTATSPVLTALVTAVVAAVVIEVTRPRGRPGSGLALALMFYGGIALGVGLIGPVPGGAATGARACARPHRRTSGGWRPTTRASKALWPPRCWSRAVSYTHLTLPTSDLV